MQMTQDEFTNFRIERARQQKILNLLINDINCDDPGCKDLFLYNKRRAKTDIALAAIAAEDIIIGNYPYLFREIRSWQEGYASTELGDITRKEIYQQLKVYRGLLDDCLRSCPMFNESQSFNGIELLNYMNVMLRDAKGNIGLMLTMSTDDKYKSLVSDKKICEATTFEDFAKGKDLSVGNLFQNQEFNK